MDNPILAFFNPFLGARKYTEIKERKVYSRNLKNIVKNAGFTDAAWEATMRSVGWGDGQAWCAYFIKIVLLQFYSFDRDWISKNITGSARGNYDRVVQLNRMGDNRYIAINTNNPQVGDVAVWGVIGKGHTAIVTQVNSATSIRTIEGNTNLQGSREGDRVLELNRTVEVGKVSRGSSKAFVGYIRRNFSEEQLKKLSFDEKQQTLIYKP